MAPGDISCNAECHNRWCRYCAFGMCVDNAVCEKQMDEDGNLTHDEQS